VLTDSTAAKSFFQPSRSTAAISVCLGFSRGHRPAGPRSSALCSPFPATRIRSPCPNRFLESALRAGAQTPCCLVFECRFGHPYLLFRVRVPQGGRPDAEWQLGWSEGGSLGHAGVASRCRRSRRWVFRCLGCRRVSEEGEKCPGLTKSLQRMRAGHVACQFWRREPPRIAEFCRYAEHVPVTEFGTRV
jgi:hypothetical protein